MSKILNKINMLHKIQNKQHGAVLMVMLVILVVGASALLLSSLNNSSLQTKRDEKTSLALAQAKEALIGYAITENTSNNVLGLLPCPDQGQNSNWDGESNGTCGSKNISSIGKLPWKTLGIPTLKDGNIECLWYAVSGTYKKNPDTDFLNWDTNGLFKILETNGTSYIAGGSLDNQPVAVIFSPGAILGSQSRSSETKALNCGGNYTTSNYLDNDTVHSINNATPSATADTVTQLITGQVKDTSGNTIVNDRVIYITKSDIFNALKKRNDFRSNVLNKAVTCLSALPTPISVNFDSLSSPEPAVSIIGSLYSGRIPKTTGCDDIVKKWRDNLMYAKCSVGTCLNVNGASCKGVVIFPGERDLTTTPAQARSNNLEKNDFSNYLEGSVLTSFTNGNTIFSGASLTALPALFTTDILACIP